MNTSDLSQLPLLFSQFKLGNLTLRNRIVMPPMGTGYIGPNGEITEQMIDYFAARAAGGVGLIITEGFAVFDVGSVWPMFLASKDEFIPLMRRLTEEVHKHGAKIGKQIWHPGRQATSDMMRGKPVVAPSPIPSPVGRIVPEELTEEGIMEIVEQFTRAAERALAAGFDLVEIHAAGGYLPNQFLSPHINKRQDAWGGSLENRSRFLVEIIKSIKAKVGSGLLLDIKLNGNDYIPGGNTLDEYKQIAMLLEEAGADLLHIVGGMYGSFPCSIPPIYEKHGCFAEMAAEIKEKVSIPVIAAGRINDPRIAEQILEEGKSDLVAMGRALLADPEMPQKARQGDFNAIRKCVGCNKGCIDFIETARGEFTTCIFNPRTGRETVFTIKPSPVRKRLLVVGGGPGGLEAARVAALRGHAVTLVEQAEQLGGQLNLAAIPPGKGEFAAPVVYWKHQMEKLQVNVQLQTRADLDFVKRFSADEIILATGASPITPPIPGIELGHVLQAWDVLLGQIPEAERIVVIGGGAVGLETAEFLAEEGKTVTVVELMKAVATEMEPIIRLYLRNRLKKHGVEILTSTKVQAITTAGVQLISEEKGPLSLEGVGAVVVAVGARPENSLAGELEQAGLKYHLIGDAQKPRTAQFAVYEGYKTALEI